MHSLLRTGLTCGVLFAIAGCHKTPPPAPVLPLADQTVQLVVPADLALKDLWRPLLQEWSAATGGAVEWVEYDRDEPPWNEPAAATIAANGGQLIVLPLDQLADADAAGMLSPFPPSAIEAAETYEVFTRLKQVALSRQNSLVAVPVSAPVLLCYYRQDLLEAAGRTPPETWDDYQKLVESIAEWAPGLTAVEPVGPQFRASLFLARSAAFAKHPQNYSVWFDIQSGEPLFDLPAFHRALETAGKAWSQMPAEIWQLSPAECRQAVVTGKAALALTWEPSASYPRPERQAKSESESDAAAPAEPFPISATRLPGSLTHYNREASRWEKVEDAARQMGFVGFTGLVMSVHAERSEDAAWHLLGMLTKHFDAAFADRPRSPCRDSERQYVFPSDGLLSPESAGVITDATVQTLTHRDLVCDLTIPQADAVRAIISEELAQWNAEQRSAAEALAEIQKRVMTATQDRRHEIRDSYRRSLGVPPLRY